MLGKLTVFILVAIGLCEGCLKCAHRPDEPVCGSDGNTHRTPCTVLKINCQKRLDIEILYRGNCLNYDTSIPVATEPQPKINYAPIDCSYWNLVANLPCSRKLDRRCGNDLKTYNNLCKMCRANKPALNIRHKGKCTDYELALAGESRPDKREVRREIAPLNLPRKPNCAGTFVPCSHTYGQMVCGSDGNTYSGECELCNRILEATNRNQKMDVRITKVGGIC